MAPILLVAVVFGLVAGFVMGWIGGRVYGRHEGRAAVLRERCATRSEVHEPLPVSSVPAAPQLPPAGPVVLVVQNQSPAPATSPVGGDYSHQLAELAMHLAATGHARGYLPGEHTAITTGHTVDDRRAALDGDVA